MGTFDPISAPAPGGPDGQPGGTVYGAPAPRSPQDRLIPTALGVGALGVLIGVLFATGVFAGGGEPTDTTGPSGAAPTTSASPSGAAAGSTSPEAAPTPTVAPTPSTGPLGPTQVRIFRSAASALCLDITPGEDPEGADLQQAACTGGPAQQWQPAPVDSDIVTLVNVASGKCLDVDNLSIDDGAPIQQWSCNGGPNQQWRLATGDGRTALVNVHSGKCVALPGPGAGPGTKVAQFSCDATLEKQWSESPVV